MNKKLYQIIMLILGGALGAAVFFSIYGYEILNPSFIEWTMHGDAAQHFFGWHFFRSEPWSFPLGAIQSYPYPQGTSLVYTDSIPLVAIPLKLLSPVLSPVFQYHGLWLLLSYMLQGYFSVLLVRKITTNPVLILLSILFFLLSPVMVQRSGEHEALTAHWIILAALCLYFQTDSIRPRIYWMILLITAVMVHFYLFVMALMIFSGYLLKWVMEDYKENFFSAVKFSTITLVMSILSMWIVGYFVIDVGSAYPGGLGYHSMNLLSPINSLGQSLFLKSFPLATKGQYEGFNYLGFGLLLLILISVYEFTRQKNVFIPKIHLPLVIVAFILFVISISNNITCSNVVLFEFTCPHFLEKWFGLVRSSGRMFWPVTYMLILAASAIIIKFNKVKISIIFIFVFIFLQIVDLFSYYKSINYDQISWATPLKSHLWDRLIEENDHVVFVPANIDHDDYVPFALLAANHKKTINVGYTARSNHEDRETYKKDLLQKFKEGTLQNNMVYIIRDGYFYQPKISSHFKWGMLDGYPVIFSKTERNRPLKLAPWPFYITQDKNKYSLSSLIERHLVPGYAIFLSVRDDGAANLPADFIKIMKGLGSDMDQLKFRGSYASMIMNGQLVIERLDNSKEAGFEDKLSGHNVHVSSAGFLFGNSSIIDIDGISFSLNRRGFNIVILGLRDNEIKRYNFDTHRYRDSMMSRE